MSTIRELIEADLESHFVGKRFSGSGREPIFVKAVRVAGEGKVELLGAGPDEVTELSMGSHVRRPHSRKEQARQDSRRETARVVGILVLLALFGIAGYLLGYDQGYSDLLKTLQTPQALEFGEPARNIEKIKRGWDQ